jgi:hypothetical protein
MHVGVDLSVFVTQIKGYPLFVPILHRREDLFANARHTQGEKQQKRPPAAAVFLDKIVQLSVHFRKVTDFCYACSRFGLQ